MPTIDINADALKAVAELDKFETALDATANRFKVLNSIVVKFNKDGEEIGSVIKSQTGAFEKLTQVLDKNGRTVQAYYSKNEEAARRSLERIQAAQDRADQRAADALARKYDRETEQRNRAIEKEIAARDLAAARAKARADKEAEQLRNQATLLESIVNRVGRTAINTTISKATNFVQNEIADSIRSARDYQVQISLIRTLTQGKEQQSFGQTGRDIRSVSDATGFDIKDVGKAFYDATSNQITKGANTKDFVKQAADFARVTGSQLPDAVNLASTAINSFNLSSADAEKTFAIFFKTIDEGRVVASEMANTMGRLYPLAAQVGVSMTEVNSTIAITTQKGLKTNDAITLMSNLLVKLEKPTEATAEFFKSLGVNSGEAAVQLYGFTGLIKRMVDAVNSGQVPVSAFFDEIRGRKQFAVFQQSIDEIDKFNEKLKDTKAVLSEYQQAKTIRGESAGDQLSIELNKLQNVFKVEIGQAILENLNAVNKWVGGVDGARQAVGGFQNALIAGGVVFTGYTTVQLIAAKANITFAATAASARVAVVALGRAMLAAVPYALAIAAAYVVYRAARDKIFERGEKINFDIDPAVIDNATAAVQRFNAARAGVKEINDPYASIEKQKTSIDETFKTVGQLVANANIANNKALDEARDKAKQVAESVKLAFSGFTDATKKGISDIKKGIADANAEIQRSKKSLEGFGDKGQEALYNFRLKYANDDFGEQKINLTQKKIQDTQKRADELYAKGTEESIAEGRKLYETLIAEEVKLEELKVEHRKKQFEADLQQHPERHNFPGGNIFSVDDTAITARIAQLTAQQAANEERILKAKTDAVKVGEKNLASEETRLKALDAALKKYESIDLYNKQGELKSEYKTQGKFDSGKFNKALEEAEAGIRAVAGGDTNQRFQLEIQFSQFRMSKAKEAAAQEKAEYLKASEARFSAEKDGYQKQLDDIKKQRADLRGREEGQFGSVVGGQQILANYIKQVKEGGVGFLGDKKQFDGLDEALKRYQDALEKLKATRRTENGVEFFDGRALDEAKEAFAKAVDDISAINAKINRSGNLSQTGISPYDAKVGVGQQIDELKATSGGLYTTAQDEKLAKDRFDTQVAGPIKALQDQFPQLAVEGGKALDSLNQGFKTLANGGVQDLKKQLEEIQRLIPKVGPPAPPGTGKGGFQTSAADFGSGEVYAAEGGIVGMFPGQPKGVDRYPIWAAKGERIINAETSAMYAPMLDAIMQRRAPRYMAEGGIVGGGTTTIGDIHITVTGANTNTETARVIGNRLERQLNQNNIRFRRT